MPYFAAGAIVSLIGAIVGIILTKNHYYDTGRQRGRSDQRKEDQEQLEKAGKMVIAADENTQRVDKKRSEAQSERQRYERQAQKAVRDKEDYRDRMHKKLRQISEDILKKKGVSLPKISEELKSLAHDLYHRKSEEN